MDTSISTALVPYYTKTQTDAFTLNKWAVPTANIAMNTKKFTGLLAGSASGDSVEFAQMNTAISTALVPYYTATQTDTAITTNNNNFYTKTASDARYYLNTTALNAITAPTSSLSMNSQKITNCLDPTSN